MTIKSISFEAVLACPCGCCLGVVNCIGHMRTWWSGCHCLDYDPAEHCDCQMCVYVLESQLNG